MMTKAGQVLIVAGLVLTMQTALAATYELVAPDYDMHDLDQGWAYEWGFSIGLPEGEVVVGASLFFDRIRNTSDRPNDLWVTLLDSDFEGVHKIYDSQGGGDYFAGIGLLLNHWENLPSTAQNITYDFDVAEIAQLNLNIADSRAGLGFDPGSHFDNSGVKLTIQTNKQGGDAAPIPEPLAGPILIVGLGMLAVRRRRN